MFVFHKALNSRHLVTAFCRREEDMNQFRLAEGELWAGADIVIIE